MTALTSDEELFASLRDHLFTAVVGDVLDRLGHRRQFLPQAIRPLRENMRIVGRAMPVLEADVFDDVSDLSRGPLGKKPFGLMLDALNDLKPGRDLRCNWLVAELRTLGGINVHTREAPSGCGRDP
jgi:4-hydroxy-4-methyl-2-oxoglutarate aldolase